MTESTTKGAGPLSGLRVIEFSLLGPAGSDIQLIRHGRALLNTATRTG